MNENIYEEFSKIKSPTGGRKLNNVRPALFDFFDTFKDYLAEYTRESLRELKISNIPVGITPAPIFSDTKGVKVTVKNQGDVVCILSTDGQGEYRLDPGEKETFWVNRSVFAATISGATMLGFISC